MAAVFLATEEKLHRNVALKIMSKKLLSDDPTFADRFLREARIVASLSHRNIVTVFDVGSHADYHYMAMELLPGGDLTTKLKGELSLETGIAYIKDIAEGLHYAGSKNLIHRDIKPDNIMFAEDGRAVITDFGIARDGSTESNMTIAGTVIGTPQYMSPEQASAEPVDHRTDLYSLGIILYQMLVGRPPFKGDSAISTGIMHITHSVPPLPKKYAQFQEFINVALAKKPRDRFETGHEFIEALSQISLEACEDDDMATLLLSGEEMRSAIKSSKAKQADNFDLLADLSDEFLAPSPAMIEEDKPIFTASSKPKIAKNTQTSKTPSFSGLTLADVVEKPVVAEPVTYQEQRQFSLRVPMRVIVFLVLIFGSVGAHVFYVNVLGKQIPFFSLASSLANVTESVIGMKPNFTRTASTLARSSNSFARFSDKLLASVIPSRSELFGLSAKEKQLVELLDFAIEDKRFYSPLFNCAELYLQELRTINPNSDIVKIRTQQLMNLSLEQALKLIENKQFEKADEIMLGAQRLLPYINDKQIHIKHRQIYSTLVIAR